MLCTQWKIPFRTLFTFKWTTMPEKIRTGICRTHEDNQNQYLSQIFWNKNYVPFFMQIWSIHVYIHILADTYWDSCATWWKLGYSKKLRFHFWWLAIHMKMSIKFSPSKVLIKTFREDRSWFIICFLVFFLLLREVFFQFDLDSVIGLTATRQWLLISL